MNVNMPPLSFSDLFFTVLVVFAVTAIVVTILVMVINTAGAHRQKSVSRKKLVSPARVALIYKEKQCIRIDHPDHYKLGRNETVEFLDLRECYTEPATHECRTADHVPITVSFYAIWQISDANAYISGTPNPAPVIQMTILSALTRTIAGMSSNQVVNHIDDVVLIAHSGARKWLLRYGITLHGITITQVRLPATTPKSDAQKEADLLDALNKVVPNVDPVTLQHAQRIIELKLASAREATVKKD